MAITSKAFLNTPHLQFTSKAKRLPTGDVIPLEAVKFSVPKVLERDEPCVNLDADDVRGALLIVRDELENNGIFAELLDGSACGAWMLPLMFKRTHHLLTAHTNF